jgi:hypothetical protein
MSAYLLLGADTRDVWHQRDLSLVFQFQMHVRSICSKPRQGCWVIRNFDDQGKGCHEEDFW